MSVQQLLEPTLGLFAGRLRNANIEHTLQHRGADLVTCYEEKIRQVLNNLIANAIDSLKLGSRLIVCTGKGVVIRAYSQASALLLLIMDEKLCETQCDISLRFSLQPRVSMARVSASG